MAPTSPSGVGPASREERIEEIMQQLRPKVEVELQEQDEPGRLYSRVLRTVPEHHRLPYAQSL
jgi:hypothetical protein